MTAEPGAKRVRADRLRIWPFLDPLPLPRPKLIQITKEGTAVMTTNDRLIDLLSSMTAFKTQCAQNGIGIPVKTVQSWIERTGDIIDALETETNTLKACANIVKSMQEIDLNNPMQLILLNIQLGQAGALAKMGT